MKRIIQAATVPGTVLMHSDVGRMFDGFGISATYRIYGNVVRVRVVRSYRSGGSFATAEVFTPAKTWTEIADVPSSMWIGRVTPSASSEADITAVVDTLLKPVAETLMSRAAELLNAGSIGGRQVMPGSQEIRDLSDKLWKLFGGNVEGDFLKEFDIREQEGLVFVRTRLASFELPLTEAGRWADAVSGVLEPLRAAESAFEQAGGRGVDLAEKIDNLRVQLRQLSYPADRSYTLVAPEPISDGANVTYFPWTDGYGIGFRAVHRDGRVEYISINPSNMEDNEDSDRATVWVYIGPDDDPGHATVGTAYELFHDTEKS